MTDVATETEHPPGLLAYIETRLVEPRPDCLIWSGATDNGYGRVIIDGATKRVHRLMWELKHGPIPDDLTVDHLCRVRACVNTAHMELVTAVENARRALPFRRKYAPLNGGEPRVLRARPRPADLPSSSGTPRTHCKRGHELTDENVWHESTGERRCLTCLQAWKTAYNARRREQRAAGLNPDKRKDQS